jgi:hypothetical protein
MGWVGEDSLPQISNFNDLLAFASIRKFPHCNIYSRLAHTAAEYIMDGGGWVLSPRKSPPAPREGSSFCASVRCHLAQLVQWHLGAPAVTAPARPPTTSTLHFISISYTCRLIYTMCSRFHLFWVGWA